MKDKIEAWIFALGGVPLISWISVRTSLPLYLFGPPRTGKTLFQRAWHKAKPNRSIVITGQIENPEITDLEFFANGPIVDSLLWRVRVAAPCTAADLVIGLNHEDIVGYFRSR